MSRVTEDICVEIFLRLPVKSILACKCVCKTWFELISTSSFIKYHINLTKHENNLNLLLKTHEPRKARYVCDSIILSELDDVAIEIEHPLKTSGRFSYFDVQWVGSCNGLVCFWSGTRKRFCVWNPDTKECKKKKPKFGSFPGVCAFGYDYKHDDYKIIDVKVLLGSKDNFIVRIYGLGTNSWRWSKMVLDESPARLFNGALHWLNKELDKIISLDISDEKFEELQLPEEVLEKKHSSITMGDFEGCLALVVDSGVTFEVWVMQEYRVAESWTKRYFINDEKFRNGSSMRLMCSLKNGEYLILLADGKLVVYDPIKHSSASELRIRHINLDGHAVNYFESLVSLNSRTYVGRKKKIKFKINPFKIFCT